MKAMAAILLAASLPVLASTAAHGGVRVALERSVVAHRDVVSVSDLLPDDAAPELRSRAARVLVGDSPLPGTRRTFRNFEVEQALRAAPELRALVKIPAAIEVTRWSRLLSRREILTAVNATIPAGQFGDASLPTLADVGSIPIVLVTEESPKIEVTQVESGFGGTETEVRAWIPSEPRVPPFWVTLRCALITNPTFANRISPQARIAAEPRFGVSADNAPAAEFRDPAVIIRAGQRVQLVMLASGMRIIAPATAMERGRQGQKIRVRSVPAGKPLVATVINAHVVQVDY